MVYLLIFNQVISLLYTFGTLVSYFIFKPPVKWNSNVEINWFSNWYFISCKNSNHEWYIINSEVKLEIINAAISKSLWLLENILNILHLRKHYFVIFRRIAHYLSGKISTWVFFQLASSFWQWQKKQLRSAMNHLQG